MTQASDPTDSQSIERTPDPSESKLSTTQTTKLENTLLTILEGALRHQGITKPVTDIFNEDLAELTALIQSEASRIALEAIGEDADKDKPPFNQHDFGFMSANAINNRLREQRTKLKALTAPEGGKQT